MTSATSSIGVSIAVPALNEETNLETAVACMLEAIADTGGIQAEILLINDGSRDRTGAVADELARRYSCVRAIHHDTNQGFGACFLSGLAHARYDRITMFPGDNVVSILTMTNMLTSAAKAEVVCAYTVNTEARTRLRSILSSVFSFVYTNTFNLHLRYINSTPVYPVAKLRAMKLRCFRYSFPSETTVRLLRSGCTFIEIQGFMNPRAQKSSALRFQNLFEAVLNYAILVYDVYVRRRAEYARPPVRVLPDEVTRSYASAVAVAAMRR